MANNKVLADGVQPSATTVQTLYTSPANGAGTRIIAMTVSNNGATTESYDLHIVPNGGTADSTNKLINARSIPSLLTDVPSESQNHMIPQGGTLQVKVSTGTTIAFRATGIEF